jgi:hypothetical protein
MTTPKKPGAMSGKSALVFRASATLKGRGSLSGRTTLANVERIEKRINAKHGRQDGGTLDATKKLLEEKQIPQERWGDRGLATRLYDSGKLHSTVGTIQRHLKQLLKGKTA